MEQGDSLARTSERYALYHRVLGYAALVAAGLLALLSLLYDGSHGLMAQDLNPLAQIPIWAYPIVSGLLGLINLLLVVSLAAGDLPAVAARNHEMSLRYRDLADAALASASSGSLTEAHVTQLQPRLDALSRDAARHQLSLQDPLVLCLLGRFPEMVAVLRDRLPCFPSRGEPLLDPNAPRSDDIEAGAGPKSWLDHIEKATGLDIDGDGTVAGVPKPQPLPAPAANDEDDDSESVPDSSDESDEEDEEESPDKDKKDVQKL